MDVGEFFIGLNICLVFLNTHQTPRQAIFGIRMSWYVIYEHEARVHVNSRSLMNSSASVRLDAGVAPAYNREPVCDKAFS